MSQERDYDIVIWGATGYTGTLVAEYMCEKAASSLRWAIAGRNAEKLEQLRERLTLTNSKMKNLPILVGDINKSSSVDKIVAMTRIIVNTVGPFSKLGTPIIDSCVRKETNYVDTCGELAWIMEIIDRYHKIASERGIKIIPSCGMESIPADLGTLTMVEYIKNTLHKEPNGVRSVIRKISGGGIFLLDWSGGTLSSALEMYSSPTTLIHTFKSLTCEGRKDEKKSIFEMIKSIVSYDEDAKSWTVPSLITSPVDVACVKRTAQLTNFYGPHFKYEERIAVPSFIIGWLSVFMMLFMVMILAFPVTRWMLKKVIPSSGTGPSRETMKKGEMKMDFFSETYSDTPSRSQKLKGTVHIKGHPGYQETAKMISESAMILSSQKDNLPRNYGVTTPAAGMGIPLVSRLRKCGMIFDVQHPFGSG